MIEEPTGNAEAVARRVDRYDARSVRRPVIVLGGDHPYAQWAGNGQAQLYKDNGLRPYLAINTATAGRQNSDLGSTGMMTVLQAQALAASGAVQLIGHGARHIQDWVRINTGIQINYVGASAAATAAVSATQLTCASTNGDAPAALTLASYTLVTLKAAVEATTGWTMTLAPELTGNEPASMLLQVAATSVKSTSQRFAAGGAISVIYVGTAYRNAWAMVVSNRLRLFGDGLCLLDTSITGGKTLSALIAEINAVSGWSAKLCDNQKAETSTFESYLSGSELAASLVANNNGWPCIGHPAILTAGLPNWYMVERQLQANVDQAAAVGITLTDFAQSGSGFISPLAAGRGMFGTIRGNNWQTADSTLGSGAPCAVPTFTAGAWRPHIALTQASYPSAARVKAIWRALEDSPGFLVDTLMHAVGADGSSAYSFPAADGGYYDQVETAWVDAVQDLGTRVSAGRILNLTPSELPDFAARAARPRNYVFNPKFQNSGEALLLPSAVANEFIVPGWALRAQSADFTAMTIADGVIDATINTAAEKAVIATQLLLPPGTFDIGLMVEVVNYSSGSGLTLAIGAQRGLMDDGYGPGGTPNITRSREMKARMEHLRMTVTVPTPRRTSPARIVSLSFGAGVNMSANKNIRFNCFARGAFDIDLSAGAANTSAVTAVEAMRAFNSAIAANAAYTGEFQVMARADNGRLVIEQSKRPPDSGNSYKMEIFDGSTASITSTLYGNALAFAVARPADFEPMAFPIGLTLYAALAAGTQFRVWAPFVTEVTPR